MSSTHAPKARFSRRSILGGGAVAAAALGGGLCYRDQIGLLGTMAGRAIGSIGKPGSRILTPGRSFAQPVPQVGSLPASADVVIVGGGFAGVCTALELAERGLHVLLCEKGVIAGEASSRAFGLVTNAFQADVKLPIIARAQQLWKGMNQRIGAESGYQETGFTFFFDNDGPIDASRGWIASVKDAPGIDAEVLNAAQAAAMEPARHSRAHGALHMKNSATVDVAMSAPAIAIAARKAGAVICQNTAVRAIEVAGGKVVGVVTEHGPVRTSTVVAAPGLWASLLGGTLGLDIPLAQAWATRAMTKPMKGPMLPGSTGHCSIRRGLDGRYSFGVTQATSPITMRALKTVPQFMDAMKDLGSEVHPSFDLSTFLWDWRLPDHWKSDEISPFEKVRIFDNEPNPAFLPTDALRDFVGLERFEIERTFGGVLTTTPDNMPIISEVEGISGLILAAGLFYGVTMAPVVGETVANIVTGKNPAFDLKPLRFSRFTDGSPTLYQP